MWFDKSWDTSYILKNQKQDLGIESCAEFLYVDIKTTKNYEKSTKLKIIHKKSPLTRK